MIKINAAKVRELFARERLTDREVSKVTGLDIGTVKRIQVDGARVPKRTIQTLVMNLPVTREELGAT